MMNDLLSMALRPTPPLNLKPTVNSEFMKIGYLLRYLFYPFPFLTSGSRKAVGIYAVATVRSPSITTATRCCL